MGIKSVFNKNLVINMITFSIFNLKCYNDFCLEFQNAHLRHVSIRPKRKLGSSWREKHQGIGFSVVIVDFYTTLMLGVRKTTQVS